MTFIIIFSIFGCFSIIVLFIIWLISSFHEKAFQFWAKILDIRYQKQNMFIKKSLSGNYRGYRISINQVKYNNTTPLQVHIGYSMPYQIFFSKESIGRKIDKLLGGWKEFEVGEKLFDDSVLLEGKSPDLLLFLNLRTRQFISQILFSAYNFSIHPKETNVLLYPLYYRKPSAVINLINGIIDIFERIKNDHDSVTLLYENLKMEINPGMKLKMLYTIMDDGFGNRKEKAPIVDLLLKDSDWMIRIHTAAQLGEKGTDLLLHFYNESIDRQSKLLIVRILAESKIPQAKEFILQCLESN